MRSPPLGLVSATAFAVIVVACAQDTTGGVSVTSIDQIVGNWKVSQLGGVSLASGPMAEHAPTLEVRADGRFAGKSSLNRYMGSLDLSKENPIARAPAMTMMAGPEELMEQERSYLKAFEAVRGFRLQGDELTATDASGSRLITFVRVAE